MCTSNVKLIYKKVFILHYEIKQLLSQITCLTGAQFTSNQITMPETIVIVLLQYSGRKYYEGFKISFFINLPPIEK